MDLNQLMKLMDMKKTFAVSKSLLRVFFAFLCGFCFHVAFFLYGVRYANVATYTLCLLAFYWTLDKVEEVQITRPIEVSLCLSLFFLNS